MSTTYETYCKFFSEITSFNNNYYYVICSLYDIYTLTDSDRLCISYKQIIYIKIIKFLYSIIPVPWRLFWR